jgi:hypothetical protein
MGSQLKSNALSDRRLLSELDEPGYDTELIKKFSETVLAAQ